MTDKAVKIADRSLRNVLIAVILLCAGEVLASLYEYGYGVSWLVTSLHIPVAGLVCLLLIYALNKHSGLRGATSGKAVDCFDSLPQPAIIVDRRGTIKRANRAAAQSIDRLQADLIGTSIHDQFHPQQFPRGECPLCRYIEAGTELPATDFAFTNQHWQQITLSKLAENHSNELIQLHVDITARKQVEEQLALVIDGSELGFWDWDYCTGKHQVNQRWLDMLGLQEEDLDNYVNDWAHRIHPEDHDRVQNLIAEHIRSGEPYVVEFRMQHKLGHWIWLQGAGAVVAYDPVTGQPSRLCGTHQNITARKQSESNLQATYQIISQSTSVVIKWDSAEGLPIVFATENAQQLLGSPLEQLMAGGLRYLDLIHPDDKENFIQEIARSASDPICNEVLHAPYRVISGTGGIKWVQDRKVITRDEQGRVLGYQGLLTDVTRQRQQNSAIRNIISTTQEKISTPPLDNLTLLAAETLGAHYTLIGEIQADGQFRPLSFCRQSVIVENLEYDMSNSPNALVATGKICSYIENVCSHFPEDSWLQDHEIQGYIGIPLLDDQNRTFGFVAAMYCQPIPDAQFAEDILKLFAAQINSELERTRAINALKIQKQRLIDAQSISHIGDWQWYWSDNHFSWSDEMYCITGTNRASFLPNFANILSRLVHPQDQSYFKTAMQNASNSGIIDFKHRIVLSDGEIRHVHQRGKIICGENRRITGLQGTMQDITERLTTEQRLREAKQQAEKATQIKTEFLANMSHEIRTPMNAIIGLVELCLNSNISSKQRDYLERVESAAHSLMTVIDDILDFSKMEAGKMYLDAVPFLLEDMLDQVFSTMEELCTRKDLALIRPDTNHSYHAVIGDPQRLRQILINLIGNAIKFTERGEVRIAIEELARSQDKTILQFSISDTGIGMNAEKQAKLFQAFSQGDSSVTRNYGGTGLGLVISKQLVEQMGGSISVHSEENVGSTFTFTVNLGVTDIASIRQAQNRQNQDIDTSLLQFIRGARILLVEDNEVNRIVAIELLEQAQLQVDTAENGEAALAKLEQNRYDCVLMDVQMPLLDGYQTTRKLRLLPNCEHLPVIAMTANVMSDDRNKCLQAGMNDFIGKPILSKNLYALLVKWIAPRNQNADDTLTPYSSDSNDIPFLYGIDSASGLQHTAGNVSVYRKILQKFAENHHDTFDEISSAFSANDYHKVYQLVHSLKGLAGLIGALQLQGHLVRLEEALENHYPNAAKEAAIETLITSTGSELNKVITSINKTLPVNQPAFDRQSTLSTVEIRQQLAILLEKLQTFDSDVDQKIDTILANIDNDDLINALSPIKKQIANYQFVDAAQALGQLIDHSEI